VLFIDAIHLKVRDGQVSNRPKKRETGPLVREVRVGGRPRALRSAR
jgi:hypothetical protein